MTFQQLVLEIEQPPREAPRRELTAQQQAAVDARQGSFSLSAAAGSGKTSVLVERFVAAITQDAIEPARLLALTFTDRAAGEIRERVRAALLARGDRARANEAAQASSVLTIHAFAQRILRASPLAAGLDPSFAVLDDRGARALREAALRNALAGFLAEGSDARIDLAATLGGSLADRIWTVYEELRSRGATRPALPRPAALPATGPLRAELERAAAALAAELDGVPDPGPVLRRARANLRALAPLLDEGSPADLANLAEIVGLTVSRNAKALKTPAAADYRTAHERYVALCTNHIGAATVTALGVLLSAAGDEYARLKREASALDFDDLELEARDLLRREPLLCEQFSARFDHVMVDEFQDTNPRQLELLELICGDHLFTVGDASQSIYGFRHADVEIFRRRRDRLRRAGSAGSLSANFRSRAPILDAVNSVFAPLFGDEFEPLRAGREAGDRPPAPVELLLTDQSHWTAAALSHYDPGGPQPATADESPRAEALLVAERIRSLVDAGDCAPGDVAILLRAGSDLPLYQRTLQARSLPTLATGAGGYWSRLQVRDLVAWLAVLANPLDAGALYAVLASPLTGLSTDALALLALASGERRAAPWETIARGGPDGLADQDQRRLQAVRALIEGERALATRLAAAELVERVVAATGYDVHVLTLPDGVHRLANIHKLMRLACEFEARSGRDLRAFVDFASSGDRLTDRDPDAPVQDADIDAVRIMTIHAAKGLEFPVVCIAQLGRRPPTDAPGLLAGDGAVGLRLPLGSANVSVLDYDRLLERRRLASAAEEQRVFYVAMTRARERLILSGCVDFEKWPAASLTAPPIRWLGPALVPAVERESQDPDGAAVRVLAGAALPAGGPAPDVRVTFNSHATHAVLLRRPAPRAASGPAASAPTRDADPDRTVPASPPQPPPSPSAQAPRGHTPQALSYTALASYRDCGYRFYLERILGLPAEPASVPASAAALSPLLRGTVVHALMEEFDFRARRSPSAERARALAAASGETLSAAQARHCAALAAAFADSPLCERLAAARDVRREHPFTLDLGPGQPLLGGVIDVLAGEPAETALVVDYKTDALAPGAAGAHTDAHYEIQRRVYALAALASGARRVEVWHCYLAQPGERALAVYSDADAPSLRETILAPIAKMREGRYPVATEPHRELCRGCPGMRRLCSWEPEMTGREQPHPNA